jgi:hypothetical protein
MLMSNRTSNSRWILGFTFVSIYLVNFLFNWPISRWSDTSTGLNLFTDFKTLFIWAAECRVNLALPHLFSVYSQIEASETCTEFTYGTALIILLSILPTNIEFYVAVALTFGVLSVFALGIFLAKNYMMSFWQKVLVSVAFFSPGTYLLFERGNLDLQIALLVVIAAAFLVRGSYLPAYLILVFASLLKFYTLPIVVLVSLLAKNLMQKILTSILTILTLIWVTFDFSRGSILHVYGPLQFGYPALEHYFVWLGISLPIVPSLIGFLAPLLVLSLLILIERRAGNGYRARLNQSVNALQKDYAFILTAITFCAMFFVALSYDYRLIFLALAGVGLILKSAFSRKVKATLWTSLMIAVWGSGAFGGNFMFIPSAIKPFLIGGFQLAGDLAIFSWVGILLYVVALVLARKIEWFGKLLLFVTRSKNTA